MKTAIVTDSNSGITQEESKKIGIFVIPMPFYIDEKLYLEDITLTQEQFYEKLKSDADIKTSMPAPGDTTDMWDKVLSEYDELVYIPMSSGLSSSCNTAKMLAEDYDGKVEVVDNQRISVTMRQSAIDALHLAAAGKSAKEIKAILETHKMESSIYISLDTLKYLKKGGRITPAAAAIGTILNLKPVLQIQGEKLDAYQKCRGKVQARKVMINAIKKDMEKRFKAETEAGRIHLAASYSGNPDEAADWLAELHTAFPGQTIVMNPLSLSVACHIGHGALAVTITAYIPEADLPDDIQKDVLYTE